MRTRREKVRCVFLVILLLFGIATVFITPGFAISETRFYVDPPSIIDQALTPPKTFTVNVTLANVTNLFGFEYKLFWDQTLVNLTSYTTHIPVGWEPPNGFLVKDDLNVTVGYHWYAYTSLFASPFTGAMSLCTYYFSVMQAAEPALNGTLDLMDVKIVDDAAVIFISDAESHDGIYEVIPEFTTALVLPLFIIATSVAIILLRKKGLFK